MVSLSASYPRTTRVIFTTATIVLVAIGVMHLPGRAQHPDGIGVRTSRIPAASITPKAMNNYGKLPLSFERNQGQTDRAVQFLSRGAGYTLFLTNNEAVLALRDRTEKASNAKVADQLLQQPSRAKRPNQSVLRVQLVNSNRNATLTGVGQLPGRTNYLRGKDASKWSRNIPSYAKVQYADVFPGVDLLYYGSERQLEYDFVIAPGADPQPVALRFRGARELHVDSANGDLIASIGKEELRFHRPVAYQDSPDASSSRRAVAAGYVLGPDNQVRFELGPYDHNRALVIDPTLSYSTYLGGSGDDTATSIAVDGAGNAYVIGYTDSPNFPTTSGAYQTACKGTCSATNVDGFVSKLDPTGSFLVYSTYIGGSGNDFLNGIALDASGNAYLAGQTMSTDFPTTAGAFRTACGDSSCTKGDAFAAELSADGSSLVYSTYFGGNGIDQANNIALDAANNAYITGFTQSTTFPVTPGVFQKTCVCTAKPVAFIAELNSTGSALVYATYLGGNNGDVAYAIVLDSANNAYVTGYTRSKNFPVTASAFQQTSSADTAAFVTKMNSTGTALVYSTYLGGSSSASVPCKACAVDITIDSAGDAYVSGLTAEANFPLTPGAFQSTFKSTPQGHDAFITELNPSGSALVFSTYYGGSGDDGATGILLDAAGNVWIKGNSMSPDLPTTPGAYQVASGGNFDAYLAELNPTGTALLYGTYLGGKGKEFGGATRMMALDSQNPPNVYVTGYTTSTNFPVTTGALQTHSGGLNDTFVSKFVPSPNVGLSPGLNFGFQNVGTTSAPQTVTITNTGNQDLTITAVNITGTNGADFSQTSTCGTVVPQATCTATVKFTPTVTGSESASLSVTDNAAASPQLVSLAGNGVGTGPSVVISPASLSFPPQIVNTSSTPQTITLSNVGNSSLTITSLLASGDYSQTNTCDSDVEPGASCVITVTFKPTTINTRTGAITITDNATGSPQTVPLSGVGTFVSLSPTSLNFGTVAVGSSSSAQTVTLINKAHTTLAIKSLTIAGRNTLDFTQTNTCVTSLAPGASCTISVTFAPTVTGIRTANVSIVDVGGGSPQLVPLTGTGQ